MMNLLQIVREACRRQALNIPTAVITSGDATVQQILGFANEVLDEVSARSDWQGTQRTTVFQGLPVLVQGNIFTMFGPGFKALNVTTFWDLTARIPVGGPMSPDDWARAIAIPFSGPFYRFRIQDNILMFYPAPPDPTGGTHTFSVEWIDEYIIQQIDATSGAITGTTKYWTNDTDTPSIPDTIFILGIRWRWRAEKGLPYLEHHRTYETALNQYMGRDAGKPILDIADGTLNNIQLVPGIWVPAGNWALGGNS